MVQTARGTLALVVSLLALIVVLRPTQAMAAGGDEVSCACENIVCKPCEVETDLTFYTAKCGPANARVKSCKKPTCEPASNFDQCMAALGQGDASAKSTKLAETPNATRDEDSTSARAPAAASVPVGSIIEMEGTAKIERKAGGQESASLQLPLFEGDVVETMAKGKVHVAFNDGNTLSVLPASRVTIEVSQSGSTQLRKKTLLHLLYGKVRTKVNKDIGYDGKHHTFQVRTRVAVAGVRGTDFVTSFEQGKTKWTTTISTLEGTVEFGGAGEAATVLVKDAQAASFVINAPPVAATEIQLRSYIKKGDLSNPRTLSKPEVDEVEKQTLFGAGSVGNIGADGRAIASRPEPVCTGPEGDMGQCSFSCENNPKGRKTCRTDLEGVACVRRLCNAGGRWADPIVMSPLSGSTLCQPRQVIVRECGEY